MPSVPHEEVIMLNIGGLASPPVGSVHTDPAPGDSGLASKEWAPCPFLTLPLAAAKEREGMDGDQKIGN